MALTVDCHEHHRPPRSLSRLLGPHPLRRAADLVRDALQRRGVRGGDVGVCKAMRNKRNNRVVKSETVCGYRDCENVIPPKYGEPGVSLSRLDNRTLICSECGTKEAFGGKSPSMLRK